jgi:effector-binding domain-containing protein
MYSIITMPKNYIKIRHIGSVEIIFENSDALLGFAPATGASPLS